MFRDVLRRFFNLALTFFIGAAGGGVLALVGFPAPWLTGAVITTTIAAFAGLVKPFSDMLRMIIMLPLGIMMGSSVTPATIGLVAHWPGSIAALVATVVVMMVLSTTYLHRSAGWDRNTALYASCPGALSVTLALAVTSGADVTKVVVAQVLRLFILVVFLPLAAAPFGFGSPAPTAFAGPVEILALVAISAVVGLLAERFRAPGGMIMGAFLASAVMHGTSTIEAQLPTTVTIPALVGMGCFIGSRFAVVTIREFVQAFRVSFISFLIATGAALVLAALVAAVLDLPTAQVFVAYAPGGLEAMTLIAFMLGMDVAYVGIHHVTRLVGLSFALPLVARFYSGKG